MDETLPSSELGTLEYWNNIYETEIQHFEENGDEGEVWFGKECFRRALKWMLEEKLPLSYRILDIGCGNGLTCLYLHQSGFTNVVGIDYSSSAIALAQKIANCNISSLSKASLNYKIANIVDERDETLFGNKFEKFDVCYDKGTYDAISLCPQNSLELRNSYIANLSKLLVEQGIFIINSCNWTIEELKTHFSKYFSVKHVISTPSFTFGGQTGHNVSSIIFSHTTFV